MIDVVVIGGGAAGLMCALTAGQRGRSVVVLERSSRVGNKILISGGGRCNFTNLHASPENYLSAQPDFCKSALARYQPEDFIAMVDRHGIRWHEKKLGQLFCDRSSRDIVEMLSRECEACGVRIQTGLEIKSIQRNVGGSGFSIATATGAVAAARVVVATGGLSLPKLGASDFAYRVADQFGLRVVATRAGLVPFTFSGESLEFCRALAGISAECRVSAREESPPGSRRDREFREHFLFTHRGLSGPAMLQISSYWQPPAPLRINLFPKEGARQFFEDYRRSGQRPAAILARKLPERFASAWASSRLPAKPMCEISGRDLDGAAEQLENWTLHPAGTEGYATAEVTVGGIDTRGLHSKTMEARIAPGLHFIGEAVDVTGWLGGYNFQWAWASGHACGMAV